MKNKIPHTVKGSEHYRALEYMREFHNFYFTPREVIKTVGLKMTDASMGRRFREDENAGLLVKRIPDGENYREYSWKGKPECNILKV